jgi:hypothetical protein
MCGQSKRNPCLSEFGGAAFSLLEIGWEIGYDLFLIFGSLKNTLIN